MVKFRLVHPRLFILSLAPSFSPLYRQIKQLLIQSLEQGEWKPGDLIPSEVELAQRYRVSQGTVRKAVDELAAEHLLLRKQGKGTFVATHHEAKVQTRFLRLMPDEGEPAAYERKILECRRVRLGGDIARQLELKSGESAIFIRRLLCFSQAPTLLEEIWLPGTLFKGLTVESLATYDGPLYGLFEREFGTRMIRAEERLRAVAAQDEVALTLGVAPGTPLLLVERVAFSYGDKPVEVRRGYYLTTRHHYRNVLS